MDNLDYVVFNESRLMPSLSTGVCILSFSLSFLSSCIFLHMVKLNGDDYVRVRLVLLVVALLTLLIYLGQLCLRPRWICLGASYGMKPECHGLPFSRWHTSGELYFIIVLSFLFLHLSTLVLTLSSFQIQLTMEKHEEFVWLIGNLRLEVTKYSR